MRSPAPATPKDARSRANGKPAVGGCALREPAPPLDAITFSAPFFADYGLYGTAR